MRVPPDYVRQRDSWVKVLWPGGGGLVKLSVSPLREGQPATVEVLFLGKGNTERISWGTPSLTAAFSHPRLATLEAAAVLGAPFDELVELARSGR